MLPQTWSRPAAALTFAGVLLLGGAPAALASPSHLVARPHAHGGTTPAPDHGSMPGMDDGSMPGMDHGSMSGTQQHSGAGHDPTAGRGAGHEASGTAASAVVRPRGLVLGVFAGFNAAVMAAAAVVRRRSGRRDHRRTRRVGVVPA